MNTSDSHIGFPSSPRVIDRFSRVTLLTLRGKPRMTLDLKIVPRFF